MPDAVGKIDRKTNAEPDNKLQPSHCGEAEHLAQAGQDSEERHPRDKGNFEGPFELGVGVAEDPNAEADDREDEECDHRDELPQDFYGKDPRHDHRSKSCD